MDDNVYDIRPLTKREKQVFQSIYELLQTKSEISYKDIARKQVMALSVVPSYIAALIEKGIPLRKGFWMLGIRSGRAEFLTQDDRRELWEIYSRITHYNEDLQYIHRARMVEIGYKVPSELQKELESFSKEIQERIDKILEKKEREN